MSTLHCPLPTALDALRVEVAAGRAPAPSPAMLERWDALRARTPRLFNGPILAFVSFDAANATIHARRDTYLRLTCQDESSTPVVSLLGVTGLLVAAPPGVPARVLLGRRSREVWACPGQWEFGPAGGLNAPGVFDHNGPATLRGRDVLDHLLREVREEVGVTLPPARAAPECLTMDAAGRGTDVVLRLEYDLAPDSLPTALAPDAWEYEETRWLTLPELAAFTAAHGDEMIAPTRAIARRLVEDLGPES
ncbi:MAG TPA: NUDIX hydrolase [Phycisphaerales bacterium]|nr:NUDIX hydrolase [Phycisphaerales bacterium]